MGSTVKHHDVFLAMTLGQGGNIVNAATSLGVEVIRWNAHRLNTAVVWALGIEGSESTRRNKDGEALMKKLAACVRVFTHAAVNNDKSKEIQELHEEVCHVYELVRRNDTRYRMIVFPGCRNPRPCAVDSSWFCRPLCLLRPLSGPRTRSECHARPFSSNPDAL